MKTQEGIKVKGALALAFVAGIVLLATASIQAASMLAELGFEDVFCQIKGLISESATVQLSLYLTFPILGAAFILWGGFLIFKGSTKRGGIVSIIGIVLGLVGLPLPQRFGFNLRPQSLVGVVLTIVFAGIQSIIGFTTPQIEVKRRPILSSVEVATVAVFSALTAIVTALIGGFVPSPTGGYTHIGDTIIFMAALLFGYKVGALAGVIGCVVADFYLAYPRWYVSIPAHGIEGALPGFAKGKHIIVQVLFCALGGFIMATVYFYVNLFIKGFPVAIISYARDLFGQVGVSMILAIVFTKIVQRALPQLKR